jgi:predicted GTPase
MPGTSRKDVVTTVERSDGASRLLRLAAVAEILGAEEAVEEARALARRIAEGRFYVACIGQFKRGKSTLINALLGESILPVGFTPVTTVPTIIRFGERRSAQVQIKGASWQEIKLSDLGLYVTEECNPENVKTVQGVEVFVPNSLLAGGMCLVDTPGLGSVFTGNTAATQTFIPHIDAALVVIGADPPLGGQELALIESVAQNVSKLMFVLSKADRSTELERAAAVEFTEKVLEKHLHRRAGPIYEISAKEQIEGRGPQRDWGKLKSALDLLVRESGRAIVLSAFDRGMRRLRERLLATVTEERSALQRPIEESERRIQKLKQTIAEAETSLRELGFMFMGEQQRLSGVFADRYKAFLTSVSPQAKDEFDAIIAAAHRGFGPAYRRIVMREAQQIARRSVIPWLRIEQPEAETQYRKVARSFVDLGNDFLRNLANIGIPELASVPHALDLETGFRTGSEFSFYEFIAVAQPASPLRWLADLVLGIVRAHPLIQNDGRAFLARLLEANSCRVRSDIVNRVQESRSKLEAEIDKLLREVVRFAEQALENSRKAREAGAFAVQAACERLDCAERTLLTT